MGVFGDLKARFCGLFSGKEVSAPEWADPRIVALNEEIEQVRGLLQTARNNFNYVTDPDAVEYYIYLQKAYEVRYDMLVRRLKEIHASLKVK